MQRNSWLAIAVVAIIVVASTGAYFLLGPGVGPSSTASSTRTSTSGAGSSSVALTSSTVRSTTQKSSTSGSSSVVTPGPDWTTYHHDNSRTGNAGVLSVSSAKAGWVSQPLDGKTYAEPLAFGGKVFVATENDSVYALDAQTGAVIWRTNLGTPVPGNSLPCGNINPSGITGTPVIDPATGIIYVVAFEVPANHSLVALNTGDGRVVFTRPADPPGADPKVQQSRSALSLANGMVYWPFGGLWGDCGDYHGWVLGSRLDGTGSLVAYMVPSGREAGIWAPSGAVVDSSGNLFVATGNGASSTTFDHGDSVVKLSPTLQEVGYFAPTNWSQLNRDDTDIGSVGPVVVNGLLFQSGKEGVGYLLNPGNLGGIGGQVYSSSVCSSVFGGMAVSGSIVFVPCTDGLVAVNVSSSSFTVAWRGTGFQAGPPVVTGNIVWTLETSSGTLHGFDVKTGHEFYSFNTGSMTRFTTLTYAYGKLFVATDSAVYSFDLGT
jgi:outer membrane protein assembly factor BamB